MSNIPNRDVKENTDENLIFPYEIRSIEPVLNSQLCQLFSAEPSSEGFVQIGSKKWFVPSRYRKDAKYYYNFKVRTDDIFIVSYLRSGSTWTQEMIWLLCNNLDYKTASEISSYDRFKLLDLSSGWSDEPKIIKRTDGSKKYIPPSAVLENQQNHDKRRFIKTHLPLELLPPNLLQSGCKTVYIARNPKDVVVSYYYLQKRIPSYTFTGDFSEFWSLFQRNLVFYTPHLEHVKQAWNRRDESDNFMFLFYEDVNKDLRGTLSKLTAFLGQSYTSEQLDKLAEHLKFDNFKNNKSVDAFANLPKLPVENENNNFIRKGKVGGWKECFNEEMEKEADEWIAENLKDSDLKFPL